jgi:hypothetical protein
MIAGEGVENDYRGWTGVQPRYLVECRAVVTISGRIVANRDICREAAI